MADNKAGRVAARPPWQIFLAALLFAAALVAALYTAFLPLWDVNDDVGMSMVAHGYGMAAKAVPHLVYSNIVWGYIVRALPTIGGVLGYSVGTVLSLVAACTGFVYALARLRVHVLVIIALVAVVFLRPMLFAQFTINAGLLAVAGVMCLSVYTRDRRPGDLIGGCVLIYFGYLIRSSEAILVVAASLPLMRWRMLGERRVQIVFAALLLAMGLSSFADYRAYQGADWAAFNKLNLPRAAFTDFGAGQHVIRKPGLLQHYGYSENDIWLLGNWFFLDAKIADPTTLQAMLHDVGPLPDRTVSLDNGWRALQALFNPKVAAGFICAALLAGLYANKRTWVSWAMCLGVLVLFGLLGRPGVMRVYIPVAALLLVMPFLVRGPLLGDWRTWRARIGLLAIFIAMATSGWMVYKDTTAYWWSARRARLDFADFPNQSVTIWGGAFPFELLYPVLRQPPNAMHFRLATLGAFTLAPFSTASDDLAHGRDMLTKLRSPGGADVLAEAGQQAALETYCKEHYKGTLAALATTHYGQYAVTRYRCIAD